MVPDMFSMHRRYLVSGLLVFFPLFAVSASEREDADSASAKAAGQRAYFANKFCGVSADRIEKYKLEFKATLSESTDFDLWWKRGWHREVSRTMQLRAMKTTDPTEYAARIKVDCARLEWQAENAVRNAE